MGAAGSPGWARKKARTGRCDAVPENRQDKNQLRKKPPGGSRAATLLSARTGTGWTRPVSPGVRCLPCIRRPPPVRHQIPAACGGPEVPAGDERSTAAERAALHGTAASGQPPRESDIYAYCWTTSFPAIAERYVTPRRGGKRVIGGRVPGRAHYTRDHVARVGRHAAGQAATGSRRSASSCSRRSPGSTTPPRRRSTPKSGRPRAGSTSPPSTGPWSCSSRSAWSRIPISATARPRYHLAAEAQHVHLVCRQCERVTQLTRPRSGPGHGAGPGAGVRDRRRAPDGVRPVRRLPGGIRAGAAAIPAGAVGGSPGDRIA